MVAVAADISAGRIFCRLVGGYQRVYTTILVQIYSMDIHTVKKLCTGASGKTFIVNDTVVKTGMDAGILTEILVLKHLPPHDHIAQMVSYSFRKKITICTKYAGRDLHYLQIADIDKAAIAAAIVPQLISAVQHLYQNHIIHCDIKPANIVVDLPSMRATLIDFGAIHFCGNEHEHAAMGYMPYIGTRVVKHPLAQMLWGIGASVYYFLTGNHPKCRERYDDDDLDHSSESEGDYTDESGNCTCVKCIDWGQFAEPIYGVIYKLIHGGSTSPQPPTRDVAVLPAKLMCDAYTLLASSLNRDTFYRAYYLYRVLQQSAPSKNAWRVCGYIAQAMRDGVGNVLPADAREYFSEFSDVVEHIYHHVFDLLPDSTYIDIHGDIPPPGEILDTWS